MITIRFGRGTSLAGRLFTGIRPAATSIPPCVGKQEPLGCRRFDSLSPRTSLVERRFATFIDDEFSEAERKVIEKEAARPQTSVSLVDLMKTGRGERLDKMFDAETRERHAATELVLIQVAGFLRHELPIRLAHRVHDLEGVPLLEEMKSVREVRDLYIKSLLELRNFEEIETPEQEERFAKLVENIYERHSSVLVQMARGAYEFRRALRERKGDEFELQDGSNQFLDRFYLCRIGIRVLIGQYLALRQPPVENYIGIICSNTSPYEIVKRAIDDAAFMCTRRFGDAPEVIMTGRLDLTFPYVPTHLREYPTCCLTTCK